MKIEQFCKMVGITQDQLDCLNNEVLAELATETAKCGKCGAELPAGAGFCPACGTPNDIQQWNPLVDLVGSIRNREAYKDGKLRGWYDVFNWEVMRCYDDRAKAYNKDHYCFGRSYGDAYGQNSLNPWGCRLKEIGGSFLQCVNLQNVIIPRSVVYMDGAFSECMRLKNVVFLGAAPKGLPIHWFYGADVYCYNEHVASYTNVNPNLIIRRPTAPLKELCGVSFTNSADFVLLVDKNAAERAKANSSRRDELDKQASKAFEEVKKLAQSSNAEGGRELRQKKEREEEQARQKKEREAALEELAGWPGMVPALAGVPTISIYGTNNLDVIEKLSPGASGVVASSGGHTQVSLLPLCEKELNVLFADGGRWDVGCGKPLIECGEIRWRLLGCNEPHWKKYDASGRLVKLAWRSEFPEYVWMTNQQSVINAKLKEAWAKKHGFSLEQAEKRAKELETMLQSVSGSPWGIGLRSRRELRRQQEAQQAVDVAKRAEKDKERAELRKQMLQIQEELRKAREARYGN